MRILAFNVTHDSSVCSLNNGKVEFFCKEERLSRKKRDKHPFKSLELYHSLNFGKIDHILYLTPSNNEHLGEIIYREYINKKFNLDLENYSSLLHHKCHAALAFYHSNFKESLVFVIDRNGSIVFINDVEVCRESESVYVFDKDKEIKTLYKSFWLINNLNIKKEEINKKIKNFYPNVNIKVNSQFGIVKVYEAATTLIGQSNLENGKTMGLSSYGENKNLKTYFNKDGVIENNFTHIRLNNHDSSCFYGEENKIEKNITKENYKYYANKAKNVQLETQKEVLKLIKKYVKKTKINNVCIVGGYGLNVVANNFYLKNLPNINFYFEPVSDDTGISIGAAILKYAEHNKIIQPPINNFYHYYNDEEKLSEGKISSIKEVCNLLIKQKSVAIFEGNPEVGPRALGHRSILFDPRNKNCKEIVNVLKNREWYRPFAGVINKNLFKKYFIHLGINESPYMTINFEFKNKYKKSFPGITHVDGTCRIQTVTNGFLFQLINLFYQKTKCPFLLNTSFNVAGEPLIQTKKEAIYMFNNTKLDALYFVEDHILLKK